jgi:hypothetical protein
MPETYNPQERTFIKMPQEKRCITCGQLLTPEIKPLTNHMNNYLNIISGNVITINSEANTLEVQGVTLYRVTGRDEKNKPVSKFAPVITSSAPVEVKPAVTPVKHLTKI